MEDEFDENEFSSDSAPTTLDAAQFVEAIEDAAAPTALVDGETAKHPLAESAEFRAGIEVGRAEGLVEGDRRGYERGLLEGRADVRADDIAAGRELGYDDLRRALIASGTPPAVAMIERDKLRNWARMHPPTTSAPASGAGPSAPTFER